MIGDIAKVFTSDMVLYAVETETPIISASVNKSGWAAVCTECEGYKGLVTVYNASGKAVFEWYSGEAYIVCADISENSKSLAVLGITPEGSRIVFFDINSTDEKGRYELDGDVIIDMRFEKNDRAAAISSSRLITVGTDGTLKKEYGFGDRYLRNYCLGSDGVHALVLSDYKVSGESRVVFVKNGRETGTTEEMSDFSRLSLSGGKLAVLTGQSIRVFSKNGKEISSFDNMTGVADIILNDNGSVIAAKTYSAAVLK